MSLLDICLLKKGEIKLGRYLKFRLKRPKSRLTSYMKETESSFRRITEPYEEIKVKRKSRPTSGELMRITKSF